MTLDYDQIESVLADQYTADWIKNPDWAFVAEQADPKDMAKVFYLLMSGQTEQAKDELSVIMGAVARDCGEMSAFNEVDIMRETALVLGDFPAVRFG